MAIAALLMAGALAAYFVYNKPHEDIRRAEPDYTVSSQALFVAFQADEAAANAKYLDKIIEVSGTVVDIRTDEEGLTSVTLEGEGPLFGVICKMDAQSEAGRTPFEIGQPATLKGLCTGMLMDVVLVRCVGV